MKKDLEYVIWVGLFAVLFIPFVVTNFMVFPDIIGKAFAFRILVEILLGLWLILIIKEKDYRPKFSAIIGAVGALSLILLVADIQAVDPYKAFWGNFERMEGWVTFIHLYAYLLILGSMFKTEKIWAWFLRAFVSLSFILALIGLSDLGQDGLTRVYGSFGNPIYLGIYFLFNVFFTGILFYKDVLIKSFESKNAFKETYRNWLFYAYLLIIILSIYLIYLSSRGVLLGLISGPVASMFILAIFEKKYLILKKLSIAGIILVVLLVAGFISARQTDFVKNSQTLSRLANISWNNEADQAGQSRSLVWNVALTGIKERPILGYGQEGFGYVFSKNYNPKIYSSVTDWFDRVHNTPLDFLIVSGILGLLGYLSIFIASLYLLWCRVKDICIFEKSLFTGLLFGYFVQGLFVFDNIVSYILFFIVLAYIHFRSVKNVPEKIIPILKNKQKNIGGEVKNNNYQNYVFIPILIVLTLSAIWWVNVKAILACVDLATAATLEKEGQISSSLAMYKNALSYNSFGTTEVRENLLLLIPTDIVNSTDILENKKEEDLQYVFNQGKELIKSAPDDAKRYYFLGSFLNITGNPDLALYYLNKAKILMPNYQLIRFEVIRSLLLLGRKSDALAESKFVYELNKNLAEAKYLYASTAAYNSQTDTVENLLAGADTPFNKVKEIYSIEASEAYKVGDKAKAVKAIQKLVTLNLAYKAEGEQAIAAIWAGTINISNQNPVKIPLK